MDIWEEMEEDINPISFYVDFIKYAIKYLIKQDKG